MSSTAPGLTFDAITTRPDGASDTRSVGVICMPPPATYCSLQHRWLRLAGKMGDTLGAQEVRTEFFGQVREGRIEIRAGQSGPKLQPAACYAGIV